MPITPEEIDALLPQTQCGLCGHGGCMPYAEAIVFAGASINLCPPGGVATLQALGKLLDKDATPFIAEMEEKTQPARVAIIREAECIGCTKCIDACPVDAIFGSAKLMHSVISSECTGCELCVSPCPVDCIDLIPATTPQPAPADLRARFQARNARLANEKAEKDAQRKETSLAKKKSYVQEALARAKAKKLLRG